MKNIQPLVGKVHRFLSGTTRLIRTHYLAESIYAMKDLENKLIEIYKEVLGVNSVGAEENFFALGGNSLLSLKLLSLLQKELNIEVDLRDIFENQTVRTLALRIQNQAGNKADDTQFPKPQKSQRKRYPLSLQQESYWLGIASQGGSTYIDMINSLYGPLDVALFKSSIEKIMERYKVLKSKIVKDGEKPFQVESRPEVPYFIEKDLRHLPEDKVQEALELELSQNLGEIDVTKSPPLRCFLTRVTEEQYFFVLRAEHLFFDGLSLDIFRKELKELYTAQLEKRSAHLEEPAFQYSDFAIWEREVCASSPGMKKRMAYWGDFLKGVPFTKITPATPKLKKQSEKAYTEREIDPNVIKAIEDFSRNNNGTLYSSITMAFALLIHKLSDQKEVVFSTVHTQRPPEIGHIMGYFMSILPIRINCTDNLAELFKRVKERSFQSQSNLIPSQLLHAAISPEDKKSLEKTSIMLNYTTGYLDTLDLPKIKCERVEIEMAPAAMGDMFFQFMEFNGGARIFVRCDDAVFTREFTVKVADLFESILNKIAQEKIAVAS